MNDHALNDHALVAPAFVEMAHRIVWCVAATVDSNGNPRTRVLHPIWEYTASTPTTGTLTGWIATSPQSPKADDLAAHPALSLTYWTPNHDTCTADCTVQWETTSLERRAAWDRFANGPAPVGYDPSIIPGWTDADAESFGVIRLVPHRLRVMPGALMLAGQGELLTWSAAR